MISAFDAVALVKRVVRPLLREQAIGMIDYMRFPSRGAAWGGPFNGQPARQALFRDIVANVRPRAIIETGTYLGTTTDFMVATGLPIYTVEADPRNYGFARARFWHRRNITLLQGTAGRPCVNCSMAHCARWRAVAYSSTLTRIGTMTYRSPKNWKPSLATARQRW